jgi:hypothetical protein
MGLAFVTDTDGLIGQEPARASVSGIVVTTGNPSRPVRRAIVSLRGGGLALGRHAITDDAGRFEIGDLPPGRYDLAAKRAGFVTMAYGASRPEWPGTALALAAGQQLSGVTLHLAAGSVITGTVREDNGTPSVGLEVRVERTTPGAGVFELSTKTDSNGAYRIYGLPPGAYTVSVVPLRTAADVVYARRDAEVDAILRQLRQGRSGQPPPIRQPPASESTAPDFVPVYYPGVPAMDEAQPIVLGIGEEQNDVDIVVRLMRTARVSGQVVAGGSPVTGGSVSLTRASRHSTRLPGAAVRADGTFEFSAVPPGRYQLVSWHIFKGAAPDAPCLFATREVELAGSDMEGLQLALRPCLRVVGHVTGKGATGLATREDFANLTIRLEPDASTAISMDGQLPIVGAVRQDGTFAIGGPRQLMPGVFYVRADTTGRSPERWWLESARTADGRDVLDSPLTLTRNSPETTDLVLTLTDQHTSLSGMLVTSGGRPAVDYTIIAVTTNREWWRPPFRRVLTARPGSDGAFQMDDLPPGDYFLAALAQIAPNEWLDPRVLEQIAGSGVPVTIGPGERKVQSLQIRGGEALRR